MLKKNIYVIAKIFDKQGCIAYRCKTVNEARCLPGTLEAQKVCRLLFWIVLRFMLNMSRTIILLI